MARALTPIPVPSLPHPYEDNPDRPGSCSQCGETEPTGDHNTTQQAA